MKDGFEAFQGAIDLSQYAITGWQGLVVFTFFGVLATVIMQSSHATLVITITALASGQITYENAIALAIGANIGTTITAIIGAISANAAGKQLAAAHLVFNGVTAITALIFLQPLIALVEILSKAIGFAQADYALKLSLFHSLFNVLGVVIMLPFIHKLAAQLKRIIVDDRRKQLNLPPHRPDRRLDEAEPKFLSKAVMTHPDVALNAIVEETRRLWDFSVGVIAYALYFNREDIETELPLDLAMAQSHIHDNTSDIDELYRRYIRPINNAIVEASNQIPNPITSEQQEQVFALKVACRDLVNAVKDVKHLQKNVRLYRDEANDNLKQQYRSFRLQLADLMHQLQNILNFPDEEEALLAFSEQQIRLKKNDILANGTLDLLITKRAIPRDAISSLMNDSQYCLDIGGRLIAMAQQLYWARSGNRMSATSYLVLEEDDLEGTVND